MPQYDVEKNHLKAEEKVALKDAEELERGDEAVFINGNGVTNDNVKVQVELSNEHTFGGLTKEELEKFAEDPFWKKIRLGLFIGFWVTWIAMLAAAIIIIIVAPKCPKRPPQKWWQKSVIYKICPASFKDSNNDGYGDFKGITDELSYIHDTVNAETILLTSVFKSSTYQHLGNDVTDLNSLNEKFGSKEDFDALIAAATKKNIKIVLDLPINNVAIDNQWWLSGDKSKFVTSSSPDKQLKTIYDTDAWFENGTDSFYSSVGREMPDLNLNNEEVKNFIFERLKNLVSSGIAGFRVILAPYLVENNPLVSDSEYSNATFALLKNISEVIGKDNLLIADLYKADANDQLYEYGVNMIDSGNLKIPDMDPAKIESLLNQSTTNWPLYVLNDEFGSRDSLGDSWGVKQMVALFLKGTPIVYYGTELKMSAPTVTNKHDIYTKNDKERTPMLWKDAPNAGFSNAAADKLWLPVSSESEVSTLCVDCQLADGSGLDKPLKFFQNLTALRKEPSFQFGELVWTEDFNSDKVFAFVRLAEGFKGFIVATNFASNPATVELSGIHKRIPSSVKVEATWPIQGAFSVGQEITTKIHLAANAGLVLSFEWVH